MTVLTDKSFDELMQEHTNAMDDGMKVMCEILLKEIQTYKYETLSQLKGAIDNHLEILESKK